MENWIGWIFLIFIFRSKIRQYSYVFVRNEFVSIGIVTTNSGKFSIHPKGNTTWLVVSFTGQHNFVSQDFYCNVSSQKPGSADQLPKYLIFWSNRIA